MKIIVKQHVDEKPHKDWTLAEAKAFCAKKGEPKEGFDPCEGCPLWGVLCATEYPAKWTLNGFTPAEVEAAKAVKLLWPEAEALTLSINNKVAVMRMDDRFPFTFVDAEHFPSMGPTEIILLDDIIGNAQ